MHEQGIKDFDIIATFSAYAPAGTPPEAIKKLEGWLNATVRSDETREFLAKTATDPYPGSSELLRKVLAEEVVKYRDMMIATKIERQ